MPWCVLRGSNRLRAKIKRLLKAAQYGSAKVVVVPVD